MGKKRGNETVMTKTSSRKRATRPGRQSRRAACTVRGRGGRLLRRGVLGGRIKWRCEAPRDSRVGHTQAWSLSAKERKPLSGCGLVLGRPPHFPGTNPVRFRCTCHSGKGGRGRGSDLSAVPLASPLPRSGPSSSFISKLREGALNLHPLLLSTPSPLVSSSSSFLSLPLHL